MIATTKEIAEILSTGMSKFFQLNVGSSYVFKVAYCIFYCLFCTITACATGFKF